MRVILLTLAIAISCHGQANCFAHTSTWGGGNGPAHTSPPINTTGATILIVNMASLSGYNLWLTDSVGNTNWQSSSQWNVGGGAFVWLLYKPAPITSTNYTFTIPVGSGLPGAYGGGSNLSATLWACSGVTADHPLAQQSGLSDSGTASTNWQAGAVTPLEAGDLIFSAGSTNNNPIGVTIDSGFVSPPAYFWVSSFIGNASSWLSAPNTSPVNPTWTTAYTHWSGMNAVFRAATAAPLTSTGWFIGTVLGNGAQDFGGDGGPATQAMVWYPGQMVKTSSGLMCFADVQNNRIRCWNPTGATLSTYGVSIPSGYINTIAGSSSQTGFLDNVPPLSARFAHLVALAIDASDCIYTSDQQNMAIRKMCPGGNVTTIAGRGAGGGTNTTCHTVGVTDGYAGYSGDGGPATAALMNCPLGVALDAAGNVYAADTANNRIRVINTQATTQTLYGVSVCAGCIQTIGGVSGLAACVAGNLASPGSINLPWGIMMDPAGNIYGAGQGCNNIFKITPAGVLSFVAGTGTAGYSGDGGPATSAQLNAPSEVRMAPNGDLYISDTRNAVIRMVSAATGNISTIAGNYTLCPFFTGSWLYGGCYNGSNSWANLAGMWYPIGIYIDTPNNRIYLGDLGSSRIRYLYVNPASFSGVNIPPGAKWSSGAAVR